MAAEPKAVCKLGKQSPLQAEIINMAAGDCNVSISAQHPPLSGSLQYEVVNKLSLQSKVNKVLLTEPSNAFAISGGSGTFQMMSPPKASSIWQGYVKGQTLHLNGVATGKAGAILTDICSLPQQEFPFDVEVLQVHTLLTFGKNVVQVQGGDLEGQPCFSF